MQIFFPDNVYGKLIAGNMAADMQKQAAYLSSSVITANLNSTEGAAALIPVTDLLTHKDLFVSRSFGLSFDGILSSSYLYYAAGSQEINKISLFGDVSSVEVILCKILFKEMYNTEVEVFILADESKLKASNVLVAGDKNFDNHLFTNGISFSEEIADTFNIPFVNYVFAAKEKSIIEKLNSSLTGLSENIYESAEKIISKKFTDSVSADYLMENIPSLILDFDEQDIEGINQLLRLPYFHGLIEDIVEVNFV